jgi:hypothetical protein
MKESSKIASKIIENFFSLNLLHSPDEVIGAAYAMAEDAPGD